MKINPFFPVLLVLVGAVVYAYFAMDKRSEREVTTTPRQYIELVEKSRAERVKQNDSVRDGQAQSTR